MSILRMNYLKNNYSSYLIYVTERHMARFKVRTVMHKGSKCPSFFIIYLDILPILLLRFFTQTFITLNLLISQIKLGANLILFENYNSFNNYKSLKRILSQDVGSKCLCNVFKIIFVLVPGSAPLQHKIFSDLPCLFKSEREKINILSKARSCNKNRLAIP